jgi:hypothetical protein
VGKIVKRRESSIRCRIAKADSFASKPDASSSSRALIKRRRAAFHNAKKVIRYIRARAFSSVRNFRKVVHSAEYVEDSDFSLEEDVDTLDFFFFCGVPCKENPIE